MHYPLKIWINHQGTKFSWSFAKPKNASLSPIGLTRNDRFCHHLFTHASIWKMSPSVYELLPRIPSYHTWRTPLFHENNLGPRAFHLPWGKTLGKKQNNNLPHFQPEQHRSLYNAKMFPVVHPFDVLNEDAGKDDILWLAYTGVSEVTDQRKINRSVLSISN